MRADREEMMEQIASLRGLLALLERDGVDQEIVDDLRFLSCECEAYLIRAEARDARV